MKILYLALLFSNVSQGSEYRELIEKYAVKYKIDPDIIEATVFVESSFNPKARGKDKKGTGFSYGLMQIKFDTAKSMGYTGKIVGLYDPETNLKYSIKYLHQCYLWTGNIWHGLDAYNRGIGNVRKHPYIGDWTKHPYAGKILKRWGI